ncbi:MAG: hypothetical protein WC647_18760 [Desulfomonilaceae bacterium]
MTNRVCIAGIGIVESNENTSEMSHKDLLFYATRRALDDAGLERKDIGGAITATFDFLEGRSLSNQYTLDSIGGVMKPCDLRLGEDGIYSLFAGYMEVMTDPGQVTVVASVQKASERDPDGVGYQKLIAATMEPIFSRPVCNSVPNPGILESVLAAMDARAYLNRSGLTEKQLARVAAKNIGNVIQHANVSAPSPEEILKSDLLSWPIRRLTTAKESDAACALVLVSEKMARTLNQEPVLIRGIGWCSGKSFVASTEHGTAKETKWAASQAYHMAGIRRPKREIDFAEVSDWYAHRELMHCEALGFCEAHSAGSCLDEGLFDKTGALPVNASGGLLGRGNAVGTSGLIRVAQVVSQLRCHNNGFRNPRAEIGLAHSWGGIPTATAGVAILGKW